MLGVLPAAAQSTGIQRVWLTHNGTTQLGDRLFGPGVAEVVTASTGTTTAGGRVSWVKYFEQDDHLGMRHVYYRQQYHHPQLGRALKVLGTAVSLHYAPDGSLRRAHLAQVADVPPLPDVSVTTPEHALAAAQAALSLRPGFTVGNTGQWPPGVLASVIEHAELALAVPPGGGPFRLQWRVPTLDANLVPYSAIVDAVNGQLLGVGPSNPGDCPQPGGCAHCSPGYDGWPTEPPDPWPLPSLVPAKARPENASLIPCGEEGYGCGSDGYRDVKASPLTLQYENETNCGGAACSYEAVWVGGDGIPQIEVYHGMKNQHYYQHCGVPYHEGMYMRVGLKEVVPDHPTYDQYGGVSEGKALNDPFVPHPLYRVFAGDAMYYTYKTMEVFRDYFDRCGFDGACAIPARVVVDAGTVAAVPGPDDGCTDDAAYFAHGEWTLFAPEDGVGICHASPGKRSKSAAQDIVAHEWGHAVDKHLGGDLAGRCYPYSSHPETCQMSEGFADVVGHIVERLTQPNPDAGSWLPERSDWIAGEDWSPVDYREFLRRAHEYDTHTSGPRWSVHAEDPGSEDDGTPDHANGNRLSVVLRLMAEGGRNPAYYHSIPCSGCDINVTPLDTNAMTSFEMAAKILFRVLDTYATSSTDDWDLLPYLARGAAFDLSLALNWDCEAVQETVFDAFRAVGYPEQLPSPCVICPPVQTCPPCCPPDCCAGVEE